MDIFNSTLDLLSRLPIIQSWDEMQSLIEHAASAKPRDWLLPIVVCESVGGRLEQAIPAVAAMACLQISVVLVDDLLDADPRGLYHQLGAPAVANMALAFQSAAQYVMSQDHWSSKANKQIAFQSLVWAGLSTAWGQYLDAKVLEDEVDYWRVVRAKSSPFFAASFHLGALYGEAEPKSANSIKQLGALYGEMIQIHDDLNDCLATPAAPDWQQGRCSLPILFAEKVIHPEQERFLSLQTILLIQSR
jgi:geranylgeranyl pyrophosphate synthase